MGLDIGISRAKGILCPHCGEFVMYKKLETVESSGSDWYDFLKQCGYYDRYYAADMTLTYKQIYELEKYIEEKQVFRCSDIRRIVEDVLYDSDESKTIIINADW